MKIKILILIQISISLNLYSQDIIFEKDISLNVSNKKECEFLSLAIINTKGCVLNLQDKKEINSLSFNNQFELIDDYKSSLVDKKFELLLGYSNDSKGYHIFYTNESKKQLFVKNIDIINKVNNSKLLPIKFKNEKFLESFNSNNKFYLLTIQKISSILKIYIFEGDSLSNIKDIDLTNYAFSNTGYTKLYDVLLGQDFSLKIQKIDTEVFNAISLTSKENKIYLIDNTIYISLDNNIANTKLLSIDLKTFKHNIKTYPQPSLNYDDSLRVRSNSYLYHGNLYQIKGCRDEMHISILNIETDSILKELKINKDDREINFKNSPITLQVQIDESTIYPKDSQKEINNLKNALRKIVSNRIGIVAYQLNSDILLTIGGNKSSSILNENNPDTWQGAAYVPPKIMVNKLWVNLFNSSIFGYNKYDNTESVYFNSLLSLDSYEHLATRSVPKITFDNLRNFRSKNYDVTLETIINSDTCLIYGYYKKSEKKYYLRKFIK